MREDGLLEDDELPYISVCMPILNRNKFKRLILSNLVGFDYPKEKIQFVIDDDGTEKYLVDKNEEENLRKLIHPITLKYFYRTHKRSIGEKRNNLVKIASYKIIACLDSDDLYLPEYLRYGVTELKKQGVSCVGSNQMLFIYPYHNFKTTAIRCQAKRQIHEATCIFTKKHHRSMGGFINSSQGEGSKMADFNEKNVGLLEVHRCMVCICHTENTINKDLFLTDDHKISLQLHIDDINMMKDIFQID